MIKFLTVLFLTHFTVLGSAATFRSQDPLEMAAEYYFSRHDYKEALKLWNKVLDKNPKNVDALMRVSELSLMFGSRELSRKVITDFLDKWSQKITPDQVKLIHSKLKDLQSKFLSDEGQSLYLQATSKMEHKDWERSLELLKQALAQEQGHLEILRQKAICEKQLGNFAEFYATLKQAFEADPYDPQLMEWMSEAHLYFKQFENALTALKGPTKELTTVRQELAFAFASIKTGKVDQAIPILKNLLSRKKGQLPDVAYYALGLALYQKPEAHTEAARYLKLFLSLRQQHPPTGWDPYAELVTTTEAKKMIAQLS